MFLIIVLYFVNVDYFTCKKNDQRFFNHTSIHFGVTLLFSYTKYKVKMKMNLYSTFFVYFNIMLAPICTKLRYKDHHILEVVIKNF